MGKGEMFDKYELDKKIAAGGMAEIFLARQTGPAGFKKQLVIKRILPEHTEDEVFVTMFLDEARLAAQLNHRHIVQILDLGVHDGAYYIAMEYIEGHTLRELVKRHEELDRAMPPHLAARILSGVCAGLEYAHTFVDDTGTPLNLVHRDISPDNVMLTKDGEVKVLDFGIAKAEQRETKTEAGVVKGKFLYMSPEQLKGEDLDNRSDIFALGSLLFELTTNRRPFGDEPTLGILTSIVIERHMSAAQLDPTYPPALEAVIDRALEKDREARFPSCMAMREDLEAYILESGQPTNDLLLSRYIEAIFSDDPVAAETLVAPTKTGAAPLTVATQPPSVQDDRTVHDEAPLDDAVPEDAAPEESNGTSELRTNALVVGGLFVLSFVLGLLIDALLAPSPGVQIGGGSSGAVTETSTEPLPELFQTYGGKKNDRGVDIVPHDGGYLVLGETASSSAGATDLWLLDLDEHGHVVWQTSHGGAKQEEPHSLLPLPDGDVLVIGATRSSGSGDWDSLVLRIDGKGGAVWQATQGYAGADVGMALAPTDDGTFLAVGTTTSKGSGDVDGWVFGLDGTGKLLFDATYGGAALDELFDVRALSSGTFVACGWNHSKGEPQGQLWLLELDAEGVLVRDMVSGGPGPDGAYAVAETPDHGLVAVGWTASAAKKPRDILVTRFSAEGDELWSKQLGGAGSEYGRDVVVAADGTITVVGYADAEGGTVRDVWLLGLDDSGELLWDERYPISGKTEVYALASVGDGGFAMTGLTTTATSGFLTTDYDTDLLVIKTGPSGALTSKVPLAWTLP